MDLVIIKDIVVIFAFATAVNYLFTKIKIPTIIGYLLTGIVAGPSLLGIIHSPHEIEFMAEIGIILLMFTHRPGILAQPPDQNPEYCFLRRVYSACFYCRGYSIVCPHVPHELGRSHVYRVPYRIKQYSAGAKNSSGTGRTHFQLRANGSRNPYFSGHHINPVDFAYAYAGWPNG